MLTVGDRFPEFKLQAQIQVANILAGKTFSQLAETLKLDAADERAFYDAHKQDYEQVRARHILIRAAGSPSAITSVIWSARCFASR